MQFEQLLIQYKHAICIHDTHVDISNMYIKLYSFTIYYDIISISLSPSIYIFITLVEVQNYAYFICIQQNFKSRNTVLNRCQFVLINNINY